MTAPLTPERLAEIRAIYALPKVRRGAHDEDRDVVLELVAEIDRRALEDARRAVLVGPVEEIFIQRHVNHERWGDESIENRPPEYAGWLPTLGEEFGEVCRALTLEEGDRDRLRAELIDLAAVALMWIDSIDRTIRAEQEQP